MSHQQGKTHRLLDFLAGKGFYVVLLLCVAAIGVSGYMLFFGGPGEAGDSPNLALTSPGSPSPNRPGVSIAPSNPSPSPVLPKSSPPPHAVPSPFGGTLPQNGTVPDGNDDAASVNGTEDDAAVEVAGHAPSVPDVSPDKVPDPSPQQPASNTQPDFYPPVNGTSLVGYSESADVFYEAMREWRYHPGVDIETNAGALVQAAADGVVLEINESAPRNMGATVTIEHSGGFVTVYSNLTGTLSVTPGKSVKAGDTIGAVGDTSLAEQALPPHLHFEILKDGEPVDPAEYLP